MLVSFMQANVCSSFVNQLRFAREVKLESPVKQRDKVNEWRTFSSLSCRLEMRRVINP